MVVFFGSGPVAAESLRLLLKHQEVEAVVTKPSTVHQMTAVAKGICVHSVNTRSDLDDLISTGLFESQLAILIDFGIIVSQIVIDSFAFGIINSHFSLLPQWRGADPISFSILSGQPKTGVSLMMIDQGMDTGKILTQKSTTIDADETTPSLTNKLINLSDDLLQEYIPRYANGEVTPRRQPHPDRATYSRKLTKQDGILDFNKSAEVLEREVRAFIDWPKSRTAIGGKDVIITQTSVDLTKSGPAGTVFKTSDKKIGIHTRQGALIIEALKPAGKKEMPVKAFLAGYGDSISG